MLSMIGYVVYVLLSTMEPIGLIRQFDTVVECLAWHNDTAKKLNAKFEEAPYRVLAADCIDIGQEV